MTEFAVMPEGTKLLPGDRVTLVITVPEDGSMQVQSRDEDIRVVERPIPEVELPTVPGYYEAPSLPLREGWPAYRLDRSGHWFEGYATATDSRMRQLMPLTRLVPETEPASAKLVNRLDVGKVSARMKSLFHGDRHWSEDAADFITAIDNGEMDK